MQAAAGAASAHTLPSHTKAEKRRRCKQDKERNLLRWARTNAYASKQKMHLDTVLRSIYAFSIPAEDNGRAYNHLILLYGNMQIDERA